MVLSVSTTTMQDCGASPRSAAAGLALQPHYSLSSEVCLAHAQGAMAPLLCAADCPSCSAGQCRQMSVQLLRLCKTPPGLPQCPPGRAVLSMGTTIQLSLPMAFHRSSAVLTDWISARL